MDSQLHDILDEISVALETEGVSEKDLRDAIYSGVQNLVENRLGSWHELAYLLDKSENDREIKRDLEIFNMWATPNEPECAH